MFQVVQDSWDYEPAVSDYNPEGLPERTITEVRLYEAGPVTWPASPEASSGIRSAIRSGTDAYYASLERSSPHVVGELRSRVDEYRVVPKTAHQTSVEPITAAAGGHSETSSRTGMSRQARERALMLANFGGRQ